MDATITTTTPIRLTAADVQRRLLIGPRRLYQLISEGKFPDADLRLGAIGRRLWNLSTVEAWEREQRRVECKQPTPPSEQP